MGICGDTNSVPSFTSQELSATYPSGFLPAALPTMENGLATDAQITAQINSLKTQGKIHIPPEITKLQSIPFNSPDSSDPLSEYVMKVNEADDNLKKEYCFYEQRYFAALNSFLSNLADYSLNGNQNALITSSLNQTKMLNKKLTYLTQLANAIAKERYGMTSQFQTDINSSNTNIRSQQSKLLEQRQILTKESASADLYKRMVEYTAEKNRANQNLLVMYGILNVTALAMIFYVARS
jgi:hypothetical protein